MIVRRLNERGVDRMREYLGSLKTHQPWPLPIEILTDAAMSEQLSAAHLEVEPRAFANRFEAAEYFDDVFSSSGVTDIERDVGLWAWLTLFYFDQVCPPDSRGRRAPGDMARYIPDPDNFRKYYRHLLAGPYRLFRAHFKNPMAVWALLCGTLHQPGEIVEQLCSRQEIVTNHCLMVAITVMYIDPETRRPKRGPGGSGAGSARRLPKVLNQFDVTWDLYSMTPMQILKMLPQEFDRWKPWDFAVAGIRE